MAGDYGNGGDLVPDNGDMGQQGQQGGYCIEIYVGPDNKVQSIEVEQKGAKSMGQPMDIRQALDKVMAIYESGGQGTGSPDEDRDAIARKVFGDDIVDQSQPGELNRKSPTGVYQ